MRHGEHEPAARGAEAGGHARHGHGGDHEEELYGEPEEGGVGGARPEQRRHQQQARAECEQQTLHQPPRRGPQPRRAQDDEGGDREVNQETGTSLGKFCVKFKLLFEELLNFSLLRPSGTRRK